ncbi:MAG: PH domain-containing protein [Prosthecobacter sp.]
MPAARYTLQNHPAFDEPLSKEDLYTLVARGSLARGEMCVNEDTGLSHTVGELVAGMRRGNPQSRLARPAFREIGPDLDNYEVPQVAAETKNEAETDEDEDEESSETADEQAVEEEEEQEESPAKKRSHSYTPSGEAVLHHAHPSWFGYTKALFLVLLLLVAAALLYVIQLEYAIIAVLCASSTLIAVGIARYSHDYIVTRERVELIWGILGRSSKEARICDIRSIDVYESGIKGLLGLGTIDFSTAANAGIEVQFKDMRQAHVVKDLVRKLQKGVDPTDD